MNCKPGDLVMVIKPIGAAAFVQGLDPMWLVGRPFKVTHIAGVSDLHGPCWAFEGPMPKTRAIAYGFPVHLTQAALPDKCLIPINPPAEDDDFPDTVPVPREAWEAA